ncbi:MAG: hypothetical protein C3F11_18250 [Methylocystaceae bacterium]|nr:MAG: hypothetical protein C3F11_18250 [Methylocystaceae bacterium]
MRNRIIELIEAANALDPRVVFLTGDLGFSVVEPLQAALGERFVNVGVAEANMMSIAGPLAALGFRPFVYSIGPFVTARCLEQIRNDIVYQNRAVRIIGVGSGFSYGSLGPSHHALEDAHLMAALPGMIVANPGNVAELDRFFALTLDEAQPAYFRIPRESGAAFPVPMFSLDTAAYVVRDGDELTLVACGVGVADALLAAERLERDGLSARVVSVPVVAPFPKTALARVIADGPVVSVFEGFPGNPFSVGVVATLFENGFRNAYAELVAPHAFAHIVGDTQALRRDAGLDARAIAEAARRVVRNGASRRMARS